jgi:hypothetical protein
MTIIEIRPFRNGWQVHEAPGVQPVFLTQEQAVDYANSRPCFRSGEIRVLDSNGAVTRLRQNHRRVQVSERSHFFWIYGERENFNHALFALAFFFPGISHNEG